MKEILKYFFLTYAIVMLLTSGLAAFISAGEESAAVVKGTEVKKIRLNTVGDSVEPEKIKDIIFSFLPSRE